MADGNPNPSNERDDELERTLDAALAKYSSVEPRTGLEERILANLRAEQARVTGRAWWQWSLAAAVAAVIILAVALSWRSGRGHAPVISNQPPTTIQHPEKTNSVEAAGGPASNGTPRHRQLNGPATHIAPPHKEMAANPKLDQFPSRQPLSAEEIALAQYVRNFPKEAQLVAQAQEEFALETEKEMNDAGSEPRPSSSIQQER